MKTLRQLIGIHQPQGIYHHVRRQPINLAITAVLIILFIGFQKDPGGGSLDSFYRWGAPDVDTIRSGHLWGLVSSNFLENSPVFLLFGLGWLWTLGGLIERGVSRPFYLWLIISTSLFAEVMNIAVSGNSYYGFAAITYSMFGFVWVNSISEPSEWTTKPDTGILFLLWAGVCMIFSFTKIREFAYPSLFFGLVWGALLGFLRTRGPKFVQIAVSVLLIGLSSVSIFWAPWNADWLNYKAGNYYDLGDFDNAKQIYARALQKDPTNKVAIEGLLRIKINEMSKEAHELYLRDPRKGRDMCLEILKLDAKDGWAHKCAKDFNE